MFQWKDIAAVLVLGFFPSIVCAWNWNDAVEQAIQKNPSLNAQREAAAGATLNYQIARSLRYPRISLLGNYRFLQGQNETVDRQGNLFPRFEQLLYSGGKINAGIDQTSALASVADANVGIASVNTLSDLREAFARALFAKEYLGLAKRIETRRRENVRFTEMRYRNGLEFKWVFESSMAKLRQAELDSRRAEMDQQTSLFGLERVLGPLPIQSINEISDVEFYSTEDDFKMEAITSLVENHPRVLYQKYRADEALARVDIFRADFYPRFVFTADGGIGHTDNNALFPFWVAGITLSIPIFEARRLSRNVQVQEKLYQQRVFELEQVKLNIRKELQDTFQSYTFAKEQVEVNRLLASANEDRSKIVGNQYKSGVASFLEWDSSQDGWVNSEIQLLTSIRDYRLQRARFEAAMGKKLKDEQ